jgi:hypothetical protein
MEERRHFTKEEVAVRGLVRRLVRGLTRFELQALKEAVEEKLPKSHA